MSSHHIIREDQEAALIIANGQKCSQELMDSLLEWSPYVLVLDGAVDRILPMRIKFDAVLGDFDSIQTDRNKIQEFQPVDYIVKSDQSKTDLEKGIEHLIEKGHEKVHVLWATGKRLDHTWNNLITMAKYRNEIQIILIDDHSRCFVLPKFYRKYYPKGFIVSIMPLIDSKGVTTVGLKYNLNNDDLNIPFRTSSSNEVLKDGIVEIDHQTGILALIESTD